MHIYERNGVPLYSYNAAHFDNIVEAFKQGNKVSFIHMTGGGKTYVSSAVARSYERVLILTPRDSIKGEWSKCPYLPEGVRQENYQMLLSDYKNSREDGIFSGYYDLIIYDEFHYIGAENWGQAVARLMETYPNADHLGVSATPIRYLDSCRDMSKEFFEGRIIYGMNLLDAIEEGYVKAPAYIIGDYNIEGETYSITSRNSGYDTVPSKYRDIIRKIERYYSSEESNKRVSELFYNYITMFCKEGKPLKFIFFVNSIEYAERMIHTVKSWFTTAFPNKLVTVESMHSGKTLEENNKLLDSFSSQDDTNSISVILSVDMLREGVHVSNLTGIVMLRSTSSPIVYLQQIGRCIYLGNQDKTLIFDLVGNYTSVGSVLLSSRGNADVIDTSFDGVEGEFFEEFFNNAKGQVSKGSKENANASVVRGKRISKEKLREVGKNLETKGDILTVIDTTKNIRRVLSDISTELGITLGFVTSERDIEYIVTRLEDRYREGKSVTHIYDDEPLRRMKAALSKRVRSYGLVLSEDHARRLEAIGCYFGDTPEREDLYLEGVYRDFLRGSESLTEGQKKLYQTRIDYIRYRIKQGTLPEKWKNKFLSAGLTLRRSLSERIDNNLTTLEEYIKQQRAFPDRIRNFIRSVEEGRIVLTDSQSERYNKLKGKFKLPKSRKERFDESFQRLKDFYNKYGTFSRIKEMPKDVESFISNLRLAGREKVMSYDLGPYMIEKLDSIGFAWRAEDDKTAVQALRHAEWVKKFNIVRQRILEQGHSCFEDNEDMQIFVRNIRNQYKGTKRGRAKYLQDWQMKMVEEGPFILDYMEDRFRKRSIELLDYATNHSHMALKNYDVLLANWFSKLTRDMLNGQEPDYVKPFLFQIGLLGWVDEWIERTKAYRRGSV